MRGSPTKEAIEETVHRLYTTPKITEKKQENGEDSIVSDLPSETLRWIKKRRHFESDQKVVLSHFRDKQLREMFQSLDYNNEGALDLQELTEAVEYVQEKTKHIKGLEAFQNIQELFAAMDDNGDGTVDFQEFTKAMTGTEKSAFDQASEYDIQRLFNYFVEFGEKRLRQRVLSKIEAAKEADRIRTTNMYESLSAPAPSPKNRSKLGGNNSRKTMLNLDRNTEPNISADMQAYNQFKVLFGFPEDASASCNPNRGGGGNRPKTNAMSRRQASPSPAFGSPTSRPGSRASTPGARVMSPKKIFEMVEKEEHLLDAYIFQSEEIAQHDNSLDFKKQNEYKQIHQKYRDKRRQELEMKDDHQLDAIALQKQAAKDRRMNMSKKLYIPGMEDVCPLSYSSSPSRPPRTAAGGGNVSSLSGKFTTNGQRSGDNHSTGNATMGSPTTAIIPARREMSLRSSARKEAYSILRSSQEVRASFIVNSTQTPAAFMSSGGGSMDEIEAAVQRISSQFQKNPNLSSGVLIKKDNSIIFEDMHLPSMKVNKKQGVPPTRASFHMLQG